MFRALTLAWPVLLLSLGVVSAADVCLNDEEVSIPEEGSVDSILAYPNDDIIDGLTIFTEIYHENIGSMIIKVSSPEGTAVELFTGDGETDDELLIHWNDLGVGYGDDAFNCDCQMAPIGPGQLGDMSGESALGDWILSVADTTAFFDSGVLQNWCVEVTALASVSDFDCSTADEKVFLEWTAGDCNEYVILRDGEEIATLGGEESDYTDEDVGPGSYEYCIYGVDEDGNLCAAEACCVVDIGMCDYCSEPGETIIFNEPLQDIITVPDEFTVIDEVQAEIEITHTFIGDLTVDLKNPEGTIVTLHDGGGDSADNIYVTYDDDGATNGSVPYDCFCRQQPSGPGDMSDLIPLEESGDWVLNVSDAFNDDDGTLDKWCVRLFGTKSEFLRGDADGDGSVFAIIDGLFILNFGFSNGPSPDCMDAADVDGNNAVFPIIDALFLLSYGFTNGPPPPAPGPEECGPSPKPENVGCETATCD